MQELSIIFNSLLPFNVYNYFFMHFSQLLKLFIKKMYYNVFRTYGKAKKNIIKQK